MYPFGSGHNQNNSYPPPPSAPFGAGYPPPSANASPYPPQQHGQPPYPPSGAPHAQPMPFGGGFGQPAPYPTQGGPPQPHSSPYPPAPGAAHTSPYPPAPGAAHSSPYPPAPGAAHSSPYPITNQSGYPPAPQSGYPGQAPNYPPSMYPSSGMTGGPGYPTQTYSAYPAGGGGGAFGSGAGYPTNSGPSSAYPAMNAAAAQSMPGGYPTGQPYAQQPPVQQQHHQHSYSAAPIKSQGTPTVRPAANFDANADAHALRKAMKGFGTDEDALINIICRRSNEQRQLINRAYKTNFGKDLVEDVKGETSGNFEKLLVALLTPIVDYYARELHDAMSGAGTDEDVLVEVLATMSNYEIHTIKNAYERIYGKNLENEIISETSGNFKRLLVSLCVGGRDESGVCDVISAQRDATDLLRAGELQIGTDESTFNRILCQRNYQQLKLICEEYTKMTGHTLERAIQKEFSGDIKDGLLAIIESVSNKHGFFAERLKKSMAGIGTNDAQLIRIIVTRSEVDLMDIKSVFEKTFGKSLKAWIKGDTSGHYKHALYAMIAEERSG